MTAPEFRAALVALGWSQASLARHLGYHARTISAYARGHQTVPIVLDRYLDLALRLQQAGLLIQIEP